MSVPSIAHVVRECLLQLDDYTSLNYERLQAAVRARYVQLGGDGQRVAYQNVAQTWADLKNKVGKPLTKEKVVAEVERLNGKNGEFLRMPTVVPALPIKVTNRADDVQASVGALQSAAKFVRDCGGVDNARRVLTLLEELRA